MGTLSVQYMGTILVENMGLTNAWDAGLLINGVVTPALTVPPGESNSITVNNLTSIDIQGSGSGTGTVSTGVKVSFSLNYNF